MATEIRKTRIEKDSLGEMEVPVDVYYGASTARAIRNFPISGLRFPRPFLRALGLIKRVAAEVNMELGLLDRRIGAAIVQAATEVAEGRWDEQFPLDIYQTGSGTSTNTNANEVIANRATELLGGQRGSRLVHPNDHVNMCQSSNDVIPTAIHLAALTEIQQALIPAMEELRQALADKAREFWGIVKTGRTHLMDATPIRLGQEFEGYAGQVERGIRRLRLALDDLREVPLGGTAVGTGTNAHPEYAKKACARLSALLGTEVRETTNHFQAQSSLDALVFTSGVLRTYATALMKIANDIRWMGSGPRAGLGELMLPAVQPGSSIMPGKVNPVIAESVIQACAQVQGNDLVVALGNQWGNFELNTMMPVIAHNLLWSIGLLSAESRNFATQCVAGLAVTPRAAALVEQGLMLATALAPVIGYDRAAEIAKKAAATGRTIREVAKEETTLSEAQLAEILNAERMTEPGFHGAGGGG
ncbi:MAG: class II fumarate hydratase [Armatimonadota bacterium]|nr:class II fumarate hydratase [Armatimonadota bacterium]MDR7452194.1 class II fumarate hydratase [Armatimonadota bacterium]MDR7468039.1 class II fumarate hydratase [Armatimonadota bacterium]MDR7494920.1 class II fumarate hydratase [Armatimonadota bacterium]MDR7500370.1 class II fumarate hydratase [Armatimonadota bacterium]